ncbi:hypothetical protein SAMN04488004_1352 [Loktanella salsilacus]|uniref:Uncharacterized protein n=1 Tax=Loktanella salsilacus TaxID=195913 RepID=A0A1I4JAQ8_9RHOB|nr:hypothetical protein [Loktanella salsilacus]SFL63655.1 hypothetical protein SAMN04488004_1352 [Loktanella salsilacus]
METDIEITREEGESKGRYVAVVEGHEAETTYSRLGASTIIIDHTGMPDAPSVRVVVRCSTFL